MKTYKVEVFQLSYTPTSQFPTIDTLLDGIIEGGTNHGMVDGCERELWMLAKVWGGAAYAAQLRKFRVNDVPTLASRGAADVPITLPPNGGITERNTFVFIPQHQVVLWQTDRHGSSVRTLQKLIAQLASSRCRADPVLKADAYQRLITGNSILKRVEMTVARPTNTQFHPRNAWSRDILKALKTGGGDALKVEAAVDGRKAPSSQHSLKNLRLLRGVRELIDEGLAKRAVVTLQGDSIEHPIDLLAERITGEAVVNWPSGDPPFSAVLAALQGAWNDDIRDAVEQIFGVGQSSIRN